MKQQLLDIIEHTAFACSVEHVRICANGLAHIHAVTSDKAVSLFGYCNTPPTKCYGIADSSELYVLLSNPNLSLVSQSNNLLTFQNTTTRNSVVYSFINEQRIAELVPYLKPKAKFDFDAVATLPNTFVEKLKQQAKIVGDPLFEVNSYIDFKFGDWSGKAEGNILLPAKYPHVCRWWWDINVLIKILSQSGQYKLGVSSKGYIGIQCKTEFAVYEYFLPAHTK